MFGSSMNYKKKVQENRKSITLLKGNEIRKFLKQGIMGVTKWMKLLESVNRKVLYFITIIIQL